MVKFFKIWVLPLSLLIQFSCLENEDLIQADEVEKWETVSTSDGLAGNNVVSLFEAKDGKMWIGTGDAGVSVYDGNSFTNYSVISGLTDNTILSITEWQNLMVLGTFDGLSLFDGNDWFQITAADFGAWTFNVYSLLGDEQGNLWFGTDDGLWRADDTSTTDLYDFNCISCNWVNILFEDSEGTVWAGTDGGLKFFNGDNYTLYTTADGLKSNLVYSIYEDFNGNIWFGYYDSSYITKFDGNTFESYYLWNDLMDVATIPVSQITQDPDGTFWIGLEGFDLTVGFGLVQSDTKYFRSLNTTNSDLANDLVTDIVRDRNGDMWISTFGGGISKYITK